MGLYPSVNAPLGPLYLPTNEGGFLLQDKAPFIFLYRGVAALVAWFKLVLKLIIFPFLVLDGCVWRYLRTTKMQTGGFCMQRVRIAMQPVLISAAKPSTAAAAASWQSDNLVSQRPFFRCGGLSSLQIRPLASVAEAPVRRHRSMSAVRASVEENGSSTGLFLP